MGFRAVNEEDTGIKLWRAELNKLEDDLRAKDRIEARVLDLYRNNDLMRGLVEKQVDTVIGNKVVLQALPDYEGMGVSREEALRWQKVVEREFHNYVNSPENWITADRSMDFTQLMRAAYRSKIFTGEMFVSREWRASPLGYKTCFQLVSSNRIKSGSEKAFHGIELDRYGAAKAYNIESSKGSGFFEKKTQRITKYNRFGWLQFFHIFEPFLPEYPRGISRLACVLKKMKQLDRYHDADLDKAIITTNYVFAITSDEDPETVADILSGANTHSSNSMSIGDDSEIPPDVADKRQEILKEITNSRHIETKGGQVAHLFKGEDMKTVAPPNTITSSDDFSKGHKRDISNGVGISYELGTGDFKGISFSGGQLSLGIYEHSATIERILYVHKLASLMYRAWLDEAMSKGSVPLLGDVDYWAHRDKYTKCSFTGAKRVHVDPVKAARSNQLNLASGLTSRTDIINENGGDIESIAINRSHEADVILQSVIDTANKFGVKLTEQDKLKILAEVVTGQRVNVPDDIGEESTD